MNTEETTYELIENYLSGKLEGDQLISFEAQMNSDENLRMRIQVVQDAKSALVLERLHHLKGIIGQERHKYQTKQKFTRWWIGVGVLVLFLSCTLFFFKYKINRSSSDSEKLKTEKLLITPPKKLKSKQAGENPGIASETIASNNEVKVYVEKIEQPQPKNVEEQLPTRMDSSLVPKENIEVLPELKVVTQSPQPVQISSEPEASKAPEDICKNAINNADIHTTATCIGHKEGMLEIGTVSGGQAPYSFALNNLKVQDSALFSGLSKGVYQLTVFDKNGCSKVFKNIYIADKDCRQHFEFNPTSGQQWAVPAEFGSGVINVYDKAGKLYFRKKVQQGIQEFWSGESPNGEIIPGYYLFVMEKENGKVEQGSITISR